jgi:hypothetical protein
MSVQARVWQYDISGSYSDQQIHPMTMKTRQIQDAGGDLRTAKRLPMRKSDF